MPESHHFDPLSAPIEPGINLIEASAGTGKTYSLAMLVLRAVVEKGLPIDTILVVTFTIAATEELRERIRQRLVQARTVLSGGPPETAVDLAQLLMAAGPIERTLRRLELALLDIDRAPIRTIHGFCQMTLQEQALAVSQPFEFEVAADTLLIRQRLVQDFWRARLYPMQPRYGKLVCDELRDPEALYRSVAGAEDPLCRVLSSAPTLAEATVELDRCLDDLSRWWHRFSGRLATRLAEAAQDGYLKTTFLENSAIHFEALGRLFAADLAPGRAQVEWLTEEGIVDGLDGRRLRGTEKKLHYGADWPLPGEVGAAYLRAVAALLAATRLELVQELRRRLGEALRRAGLISFDDLVTGLADALSGPNGDMVRSSVAGRYQMALIDEFQDTDGAQWLIFSRLFGGGHHYLYLIGDPKQAIYRFRGADIDTYYIARKQADRCLSLARNFRAHPALMGAVNDLFREAVFGEVPYQPVEPARSSDQGRLCTATGDESGLCYCYLEPPVADKQWTAGNAADAIGSWIVDEVRSLLHGRNGLLLFDSCGAPAGRRVEPADIAVLVRTNNEAAVYQDRFLRAGIPAVVTGRRSVFHTAECRQLELVLRAVSCPGDIEAIKTALGCDWFGLDGVEHFLVGNDETTLSAVQERFGAYLRRWQKEGFLAMFMALQQREAIFITLGRGVDGARRVTNIVHLVELLQEHQQRDNLTIEQAIVWLAQMASDPQTFEAAEMRLETDARALQIVTMHSAKGLEFPVVFCPSLLNPGDQRKTATVVFAHDDDGQRICDLGSERSDDYRQRALEEERQERLRLTYVAITRAVLRCYVVWAEIKAWGGRPSSFASPLGGLLFPGGQADPDAQCARLQALGSLPGCAYRRLDLQRQPVTVPDRIDTAVDGLSARPPGDRSLHPRRIRTSFSGLTALTAETLDEPWPAGADEGLEIGGPGTDSGLPAGSRFGTVVHELLEEVPFAALADGSISDQLLIASCRKVGVQVDLNALRTLLRHGVTTVLGRPGAGFAPFALVDLDPLLIVKEVAFTLHLRQSSTHELNELLAADPACLPLAYRRIEGYLTGFIDLLGQYNGRYFLIDYKTNWLGDDYRAYGQDALLAAMRSHNYGLQYWLYTVVLHRFLRRWLPGYEYEHHFGGVLYPFVRGMRPEQPGSGVYQTLPDAAVVARLDHCFGGAS